MKIFGVHLLSHDDSAESPINFTQLLQRPSLWATLFFVSVALALGA